MANDYQIAVVKKYLRRTKTTEELEDLSATTFASATEEVTITSIGTEGSNSSGQVTFPKWLLLAAIEELLEEGTQGRQIASIIDRSMFASPL